MSKTKHILSKLPSWIFSILALAIMCWLTLSPNPLPDETPAFDGADLLAHGLMFGGITFCFLLDAQRRRWWLPIAGSRLLWCFLCASFIGVAIEYIQKWMELGRCFEVADMEADAAGSLFVVLCWYFLQKFWSSKPEDVFPQSGLTSHNSDSNDLTEDLSADTEADTRFNETDQSPESNPQPSKRRRPRFNHQIKSAWIRVPLKLIFGLLLFLILLPIIIYIPPVQTFMKDVATSVMRSSTGMDVKIDKFRIRFPLDVELKGVSVVEATGDTMVRANSLIADVKLLPLLKNDVDVKKLRLEKAYYRMVSPDTSMIMKIRAQLLDIAPGTNFDLKAMALNLDKGLLKDGDIALYMDAWKKKPSPDSTQTQMLIKARQLDLDNVRFGMSMLPTIDTLNLAVRKLQLENGIIDLTNSNISASSVTGDEGDVTYLVPTPQYVKAHPAPIDTISPPSPPMTIAIDSIALTKFDVLYATKGVKPAKGFDPGYIQLKDVNVGLRDFYNQASQISLPIIFLSGRERSGLAIQSGSGTVSIDSIGLNINNLRLRTSNSVIHADADVPFALMEMNPKARMSINADAALGFADIRAFLPMAGNYLSMIPGNGPIKMEIDALGSLSDLTVKTLRLDVPQTLSLFAKGWVKNPLDFKKMQANVQLDGRLTNPGVADRLLAIKGMNIPALEIKGTAGIDRETYTADIDLRTTAGDLAGKGRVALNAETYIAEFEATGINVGQFMPDLGIGRVSATVSADGAGFNPLNARAHTDTNIHISSIEYKGTEYRDINAKATLGNGAFDVLLSSPNPAADLNVAARGTIGDDLYVFNVDGDIRHLDLLSLGLSETMNNGDATFHIEGSASPARWLYDVTFNASNINWNLPDMYIHLPNGVNGRFLAENEYTSCFIDSDQTSLDFNSPTGMQQLIDSFSQAADAAMKQVDNKHLLVDELHNMLPTFDLSLSASGRGLLNQFLQPNGMAMDTLFATIENQDILKGDIGLRGLNTGSVKLDTISLNLKQRESLLDYRAHIGNRPGTLDEFANVDLMGYAGGNRASLSVKQRNIQNETGYRVGLTAAVTDSLVTVHFTPLKATIAYMPWTINPDNHIDVDLNSRPIHIAANLEAQSNQSAITLRTQPADNGNEELFVRLKDIHIEDFLRMSVFAPPVTACVSSEMHVGYLDGAFSGKGNLNVTDFTYEKQRIGDFDLLLDAGLDLKGISRAELALLIDQKKALAAHCILKTDSVSGGILPEDLGISLSKFPLQIINPFIGADVAQLSGGLSGEMDMTGSFTKPLLNGEIHCDSVSVRIPMMASSLRFENNPITVTDNVIDFNNFKIWGQNNNPLTIGGKVDASDFSNVLIDIALNANNFQLVNNDRRARSDIYGKLFLNLGATARGSTSRLNVNGNLTVLNTSDITYALSLDDASTITQSSSDEVVRFVQFSDTTANAKKDSVAPSMAIRIAADVNINPGTQVNVLISSTAMGNGRVQLHPSGSLSYFQNYMGDMRLNGQLNLGTGFARYSVPVVGEKRFDFTEGSYVMWNGEVMNPVLNIKATDVMKTNVTQSGGNSKLINFKVGLDVSNTLSSPKVIFDLSTDDDISIQNELSSMTADQRSQQAINLLLYGQYSGPGTKTASSNIGNNALYGILTSQLNSWAAKTIRGVDLSFGIDQYDQSKDGQNSTTTSYSYQVSKSLFNNKFKIVVGGNYSTDASADENFSENLISDISFEYMLKQTTNLSMYLRAFRHTGYESILEGEITEMGGGFVLKRRLSNLKDLFRIRFGRRKNKSTPDSTAIKSIILPVDSQINNKPEKQ